MQKKLSLEKFSCFSFLLFPFCRPFHMPYAKKDKELPHSQGDIPCLCIQKGILSFCRFFLFVSHGNFIQTKQIIYADFMQHGKLDENLRGNI